MPRQPTLETRRLLLRPFRMADAEDVQRMAGDHAVADTTLKIPHPYEDGQAEVWIRNHRDWFASDEQAVFAIVLRNHDTLVGAIGLRMEREDQRAELGYWIGKSYWSQGYCTEAARAVIEFGFEQLGLHRIYAYSFSRNTASARVMQKLCMIHEGHLRQHVRKWDAFEDLELYGILKSQWSAHP